MRLIQLVCAALSGLSLTSALALPSEPSNTTTDLISTKHLLRRDAFLTSASITFHTNDEDKDGNSHLTITVKDSTKSISAALDSDFARFGDNNDDGPFDLEMFNPSSRADVRAGTVTLRLDPHGQDTWRFNWQMTFVFSDGTKMRAQLSGVELTQDKREKTWNVVG
ncbi:hypothetical protein B0H66DRAFT_626443 [Apodospora peruviana]|uniref:PLAT domain-containing protein n=1 Tax=Apodospora peruviana TaxID=516989 RepID=A0AAE0I1Z6_9PEZI|nr:hypothetical protein B0H66DRAFT_626443 [Apodospora peruviana]